MLLAIYIDAKPQTEDSPYDNQRQTAVMDDAFLPLLLRQIFRRRLRLQRADIADVFATLITVVIALWHLGMAERAAFHHRFGFPYDEQSDKPRPLRIPQQNDL